MLSINIKDLRELSALLYPDVVDLIAEDSNRGESESSSSHRQGTLPYPILPYPTVLTAVKSICSLYLMSFSGNKRKATSSSSSSEAVSSQSQSKYYTIPYPKHRLYRSDHLYKVLVLFPHFFEAFNWHSHFLWNDCNNYGQVSDAKEQTQLLAEEASQRQKTKKEKEKEKGKESEVESGQGPASVTNSKSKKSKKSSAD